MKTTKTVLKNALVVVVALVFVLGSLEMGFRILNIFKVDERKKWVNFQNALDIRPHPFYPDYNGQELYGYLYSYKPYSVWAHCWPDNPSGYFDNRNCITYRINGHGFRDHEFKPKKDDVFRIMVVGDSLTFGEGVRLEDTYPKVLEGLLQDQGLSVEVLNLGVNGYDVKDEVALLNSRLNLFFPDMVIWGFFINDISHGSFDAWARAHRDAFKDTSWSHLVSFVKQRLTRKRKNQEYIDFIKKTYDNPEAFGEMLGLLGNANTSVKDHGAEMLFANLADLNGLDKSGYAFSPINERIFTFLAKEGIARIDSTGTLNGHDISQLKVHSTDAHYNAFGHELVAKRLLASVKSRVEVWQLGR